jgi:hypothetical protein
MAMSDGVGIDNSSDVRCSVIVDDELFPTNAAQDE